MNCLITKLLAASRGVKVRDLPAEKWNGKGRPEGKDTTRGVVKAEIVGISNTGHGAKEGLCCRDMGRSRCLGREQGGWEVIGGRNAAQMFAIES